MNWITTSIFGGAALGVFVALWHNLKAVGNRLTRLGIVSMMVCTAPLNKRLVSELRRRFRELGVRDLNFVPHDCFIKKTNNCETVVFETPYSVLLFFWTGRTVVAARVSGNIAQDSSCAVTLKYLRGTFDGAAFIHRCCCDWKQSPDDESNGPMRYRVKRLHGTVGQLPQLGSPLDKTAPDSAHGSDLNNQPRQMLTAPDLDQHSRYAIQPLGYRHADIEWYTPLARKTALANLALSAEVEAAVCDLKRWLDSKKWYQEREIAWRHGVLLYGPPGTGKTATINAAAFDYDVPIYHFDLASMTNADFSRLWQEQIWDKPRFALFEDFDSVFEGRKNVTNNKHSLTFDCFLNTIGGAFQLDGVCVVITTNRPETLDAALTSVVTRGGDTVAVTSRPGRIDTVARFTNPDTQGLTKIARRILLDYSEDDIASLVQAGNGDTGAQFVNRCRTDALARYWKQPSERVPAAPVAETNRLIVLHPSANGVGGVFTTENAVRRADFS